MERATTAKHGAELNPLDTTGLCLLSLDGGGVRGLSTLYILKSIMNRLNHERKAAALPPVKPCEIFDLIGGTNTGGLIAIMLGRLEMDVDECITAYSELAAAVFGEQSSHISFNIIGKEVGLNADHIRFVCAADCNTRDIVRLRSYSLPDELNVSATIYQVALATSAATTFFDPVSIGDHTFADSALGANNPVDEVEGEASNIWCSETRDLKRLVKCFISIGTGNPGKKPFENSMIKFLRERVLQIVTETSNTEKKFIARWARHFDEKRYFRFDVDQGLQDIGLDEYQNKGTIQLATAGYLTHTALKFRVQDCIQNLRLKQSAAFWIVPFDRNHRFTGRKSQLSQLQEMLFIKDQTTKIAVVGLGGIGKSQLVLELIYRIREKHKTCPVIWIPAMNMESLQQAYRDVAQQLGIGGWDDNKSDVKTLVNHYLNKENVGQWILVFDNADNIDMWIKSSENGHPPLIGYLPRSSRGCIIFTTRNREVAVELAHQNVVEVTEMSEETATDLLQNYLVNKDLANNRKDTKALLLQLTCFPLAIAQAAAYINENGITLGDYLLLLGEQEEEVVNLLSEEYKDEGRYRSIKNPVAITWLISFEQIRQKNLLEAEFLSFIACVDPNNVPQSLLPPAHSRKKEIDAIRTLDAYSFIIKHSADGAFDIHQLVHLAIRGWLRKEKKLAEWTERAVARLNEVFPDSEYRNRNIWRRYLTHARSTLGSKLIDNSGQTRISLAWKFANCLYSDGRFTEAGVRFTEVLEIRKRVLGAEHPATLDSMNNLASTYGNQGRWEEAEKLEAQAMEIRKRVLGAEHPDTLSSMNNLALTYQSQGRWEEAEKLFMQVIEIRKEVLGIEHSTTLSSMNNLALTYQSQGRWEEAEKLEVQVIEIRKEVLGIKHPATLTSMANLASMCLNQGRWEEAEKLEAQVIEIRKEVLGIEHPATLISMANLASMYLNQGRWEEAEKLFVQVIEIRKEVLGIEHPATLTSMANL
ncbi:hypothetical protein OIDMADRAFT_202122, partial [Oidiodendron maius Zn]